MHYTESLQKQVSSNQQPKQSETKVATTATATTETSLLSNALLRLQEESEEASVDSQSTGDGAPVEAVAEAQSEEPKDVKDDEKMETNQEVRTCGVLFLPIPWVYMQV